MAFNLSVPVGYGHVPAAFWNVELPIDDGVDGGNRALGQGRGATPPCRGAIPPTDWPCGQAGMDARHPAPAPRKAFPSASRSRHRVRGCLAGSTGTWCGRTRPWGRRSAGTAASGGPARCTGGPRRPSGAASARLTCAAPRRRAGRRRASSPFRPRQRAMAWRATPP